MIIVGKWSWPLRIALPLVVVGGFFAAGLIRPVYRGQATLVFSGSADEVQFEIDSIRTHISPRIQMGNVPGKPRQLNLTVEASRPRDVIQELQMASGTCSQYSMAKRRAELGKTLETLQQSKVDLEKLFDQLREDRKLLLAGPRENTPRAQLVARIEELKNRRQLLIERFPRHTDIQLLASQIQELILQMGRPSPRLSERLSDIDRQINETRIRSDYYVQRLHEVAEAAHALKPAWTLVLPIQKPQWPHHVEGGLLGSGLAIGLFIIGMILFKSKRPQPMASTAHNGLWKPQATESKEAPAPTTAESPVTLSVVTPESVATAAAPTEENVPMDPLTEKAAELYRKWVDIAKVLYEPAAKPPQGVLDQVAPMLQETSEYLPKGHDALARYLARCVTSGDLAAHVARTVLMTLTGAQEAGVSPEHSLAMALAALFHDLAVVARPPAAQEEVGSEVGRLSASVLHRIPGLQPAIKSMVEDILIGMDEFKLETWQNVATGKNLEPFSKVLREIDRFEKVMQKQKARLDRQILFKKSA